MTQRTGRPVLFAEILLFAFLPLFFSGCLATQQDMETLESQSDILKGQVSSLSKTVSDLQANQADLSSQMSQLHDDLKSFTATIQDSQAQMTRLSAKLDDMSAQVTTKVASIGSALTSEQAAGLKEQKEAFAKQEAEILNQASPTALFDAASARLAVKSYGLAAKGFSEYLKEFPNGALADIALYKLGEAYYGMGDWQNAGQQFALVLEKYPKNDLTASARLMYALCLVHLGKNLSEAKQYLESIVSDFPNQPEANAAKTELKRLSKSSARKKKPKKSATAEQ